MSDWTWNSHLNSKGSHSWKSEHKVQLYCSSKTFFFFWLSANLYFSPNLEVLKKTRKHRWHVRKLQGRIACQWHFVGTGVAVCHLVICHLAVVILSFSGHFLLNGTHIGSQCLPRRILGKPAAKDAVTMGHSRISIFLPHEIKTSFCDQHHTVLYHMTRARD